MLTGAPADWVRTLLEQGEFALLADDGGLDAVAAVARAADLATVPLLRVEPTAERQEATVMRYAGSRPLVWVAPAFGDEARRWARERGPMTLLVEAAGALSDDDRRRVERFVVILGRQAE